MGSTGGGKCRFNEILITLIIIFTDKLIQIEVARINEWARYDLFYDSVTEGYNCLWNNPEI